MKYNNKKIKHLILILLFKAKSIFIVILKDRNCHLFIYIKMNTKAKSELVSFMCQKAWKIQLMINFIKLFKTNN